MIYTILSIFASSILSLLIALLIFKKESKHNATSERNRYKRLFVALLSELADNLALINKTKENLKPENFFYIKLSKDIINEMLINPLTYRLTGEEYMLALRSANKVVDNFNSFHELLYETFKKDRLIGPKLYSSFLSTVEECEYVLLVLEVQNQFYINSYAAGFGITPSNSEEIKAMLKEPSKHSISELRKKLEEIDNWDDKTLKSTRTNLIKAVEEQEKEDKKQ